MFAPFLRLGRLTRELAASLLQRVVVGAQHADGGGVRGLERRLGLALARGRVVQLAEDAHRACGEGARGDYRNGSGGCLLPRNARIARDASTRGRGPDARGGVATRTYRALSAVARGAWTDVRSVARARPGECDARGEAHPPRNAENGKMLSEGGTNSPDRRKRFGTRSVPIVSVFGLQIQTQRACFFFTRTQSAIFPGWLLRRELRRESRPTRLARCPASLARSLQSWHTGVVGQIWGTPRASWLSRLRMTWTTRSSSR